MKLKNNTAMGVALLASSVLGFCRSALAEEGFYNPGSLPSAPANLNRIVNSSVHFTNGNDPWCSGTWISNDGYVLTASHCIHEAQNCMGAASQSDIFGSNIEEGGVAQVHFSNIPANTTPQCSPLSATYIGADGNSVFVTNPKVVFLGGFVDFDDPQMPQLSTTDLNVVRSYYATDFAILKFDLPSSAPCNIASKDSLKPADPIWTFGFPGQNFRISGNSSNGVSLYASLGTVLTAEQSDYLNSTYPTSTTSLLASIYDQQGMIMSNSDTYDGDSGAGVVNAKGEIVGELIATAEAHRGDNLNQYLDGTSIAISLAQIRNVLTAKNPGLFQTAFQCR